MIFNAASSMKEDCERPRTGVGEQAEKIVDGIIADLCDRGSLQNEWEGIDGQTRAEIRSDWMLIARRVIERA